MIQRIKYYRETLAKCKEPQPTLDFLKDDFLIFDNAFKKIDVPKGVCLSYNFILTKLLQLHLTLQNRLLSQIFSQYISPTTREQQELIWAKIVEKEPRLDINVKAAIVIQKYVRRWFIKRNVAAIKIQRRCHNWLYKPMTRDGKYGINLRLLMNYSKENSLL